MISSNHSKPNEPQFELLMKTRSQNYCTCGGINIICSYSSHLSLFLPTEQRNSFTVSTISLRIAAMASSTTEDNIQDQDEALPQSQGGRVVRHNGGRARGRGRRIRSGRNRGRGGGRGAGSRRGRAQSSQGRRNGLSTYEVNTETSNDREAPGRHTAITNNGNQRTQDNRGRTRRGRRGGRSGRGRAHNNLGRNANTSNDAGAVDLESISGNASSRGQQQRQRPVCGSENGRGQGLRTKKSQRNTRNKQANSRGSSSNRPKICFFEEGSIGYQIFPIIRSFLDVKDLVAFGKTCYAAQQRSLARTYTV